MIFLVLLMSMGQNYQLRSIISESILKQTQTIFLFIKGYTRSNYTRRYAITLRINIASITTFLELYRCMPFLCFMLFLVAFFIRSGNYARFATKIEIKSQT